MSGDLANRQRLAELHPPDLGEHAHCDRALSLCSRFEQVIQSRGSTRGSNLDEIYCLLSQTFLQKKITIQFKYSIKPLLCLHSRTHIQAYGRRHSLRW